MGYTKVLGQGETQRERGTRGGEGSLSRKKVRQREGERERRFRMKGDRESDGA